MILLAAWAERSDSVSSMYPQAGARLLRGHTRAEDRRSCGDEQAAGEGEQEQQAA